MRIKSRHFIKTEKTKGLLIFEIESITQKDIEHLILMKLKEMNIE
jgi:hypothetical protein